jgi:phosphomevalonate kinase
MAGIALLQVRETQAQQPMPAVWIVVDARRPSDLAFFASRFPCLSVRVTCPDDVRTARGWVFTQGTQ